MQAALDAAQPGDVILLEAGATFTGNFVLPRKAGTAIITLQSAPGSGGLPPAGQRIGPAWAPSLAKLRSGNSASALRTAPGAHHWRIRLLEFLGNKAGYGDIIRIGDGSSAQNTLDVVPHDIEIDQVYVHGDALVGQKRGIAINASRVTVRNSFVADCKAVGMDAQAIAGWNGPGPYLIENNYLEGAAENVLFGGSDPAIAGLVASDIIFRRNHVAKPVAWRQPIIATPAGLTATTGAGGTLPAGGSTYLVVARRPVGQTNTGRSTAASIHVDVPAEGWVHLQWAPVPNATQYQVFARGSSWTVTSPAFRDTGAAGTAASAPTGSGTRWLVKNLFELKNARRVTIESNVFEANWQDGQAGYAIVFTPRNSGNQCDWCEVQDVAFEFNIVRHSAAGVNILGYDSPEVSRQASNIRIRHNLFQDISRARWGGNGWFLLVGDEPRDIIVDHNTIDHDGTAVVYAYGGTGASPRTIRGFQLSNNLARHDKYGINGASFAFGAGVIGAYFPDGIVQHNLLSAGPASRYPVTNYFDADFAAVFTDLSAGDYTLRASSMAKGRATDGTDLGANMPVLLSRVAEVAVKGGRQMPITAPRAPSNLRVTR